MDAINQTRIAKKMEFVKNQETGEMELKQTISKAESTPAQTQTPAK